MGRRTKAAAAVAVLALLAGCATVRVSVASGGDQANGDSTAVAIGADGRFVAFSAYTLSLVPGGTNDVPQVWLWDTHTDRLRNVSRLSGIAKPTWGLQPSVSREGRRVALLTTSYDAATFDSTPARAVVYDRRRGVAPIIDLDPTHGSVPALALSDSGEDLAFISSASTLVDQDTNGSTDVFVRSLRDAKAFHPVTP